MPSRYRETTRQWIERHAATFAGDECLIYPFKRYANGYGGTWVDGVETYAHRHMCKMKRGPAPTPEHEAAHWCGNGKNGCVNPNHLRWATHFQNMADTVDVLLIRDASNGRFIGLIEPAEAKAEIRVPRPPTRRKETCQGASP